MTMPPRRLSTLACCQEPFGARLETSPLKSTRSGKASTSCPARTTGSARMQVPGIRRAYWPSSSSIQRTTPWLYQTRGRDRYADDGARRISDGPTSIVRHANEDHLHPHDAKEIATTVER